MTTTEVITPRLRTTLRRALFWGIAGLVVILVGVVSLAAAGSAGQGQPLDPTNAGPAGTMAVAEVLRQQGVDVEVTTSLDDTRDAIESRAATTLFIYDVGLYLTDEQLVRAVGLADTVILADPTFDELKAVAPELAQAGIVEEDFQADCSIGAVERAGTVTGGGSGFRVVDPDADALTCLGSGDDVYSLIEIDSNGTQLRVLGATAALTNESIIVEGNAAFALGLLGENDKLVWYLPSFDDLESDATIDELTPAWVVPVMLLLGLTFVVAAIWRGRRLGPLVIENLPVTVKSSETMLGRARLYEKSSSRLRALDALRVGTIQRLAAACGLPRRATVDEVIAAVAALTGGQVHDIHLLLVEANPHTDRDLIAYSDALLTLERDVAARLRS